MSPCLSACLSLPVPSSGCNNHRPPPHPFHPPILPQRAAAASSSGGGGGGGEEELHMSEAEILQLDEGRAWRLYLKKGRAIPKGVSGEVEWGK